MLRWGKIAIVLGGVLYTILTAALWVVMKQPLARFGAVMAHVPGPLFLILPFEPLWLTARSGHLEPGDLAPDFRLPAIDKASYVRLSDNRGRPVVLIFGSYT